MLKSIPSELSPQLLKVLMEMGHGDEIVIADGNFPSASHANHLVRCDGLDIPTLWKLLLVSGFAGALTTFSTLNKELLELWNANRKLQFLSYISFTYVVGILLGYSGFLIGVAL